MPLIYPNYNDNSYQLLPIYPVRYGIDYKQHACSRPLGAPFHQIYYVENGECCVTVNGEKRYYTKGSVMYMAKGFPIRYEPVNDDFRAAFVSFNGQFADSLIKFYRADKFMERKSEKIGALIHQGFELAQTETHEDILSKHTFDLAIAFFNHRAEQPMPQTLKDAQSYIADNYYNDISVADIASAVGVSSSLLSRMFRSHERLTPVEYLRNVRLEHARQLLLQDPEISVSEVANRCGFIDAAYFCKVFKSRLGKSPKTYVKLYSISSVVSSEIDGTLNQCGLSERTGTNVIIDNKLSDEPIIVSSTKEAKGSAWIKNDGYTEDGVYHPQTITWSDGHLIFSGRDISTRHFFYVSDMTLMPGKYSLSVDMKTAVMFETTAVRIGVSGKAGMLFDPGITCVAALNNSWKTHTVQFTVDSPTYFQINWTKSRKTDIAKKSLLW